MRTQSELEISINAIQESLTQNRKRLDYAKKEGFSKGLIEVLEYEIIRNTAQINILNWVYLG